MSRILHTDTPHAAATLLDTLARPREQVDPVAYRAAMSGLGEQFAEMHVGKLAGIQSLLLVCTNEDADFLARGVLNGLSRLTAINVRVACFWNDRVVVTGDRSGDKVDIAPIVRRYVEPGEVEAFLVVKSIISSACVVRTNITELVYERNPRRVLIFAPVILKGAETRVAADFELGISDRFEFYWFAQDDKKDGENVLPGIGGQVYERLGIGNKAEKNAYIPSLIRERRTNFTRAA